LAIVRFIEYQLTDCSLESSLNRHSKRCLKSLRAPSRQKSCRQCITAKTRCDLQRPHCGRCQSRSIECGFQPGTSTATPPQLSRERASADRIQPHDENELLYFANADSSSPTTTLVQEDSSTAATSISSSTLSEQNLETASRYYDNAPDDSVAELLSSKQRSQILLGTPHGIPSTDTLARHTMFFVIRVLRSWTRMMATNPTSWFPPIIHHLQLRHGLPISLAYCYTLVKMWIGHEHGSRELVHSTIIREIQRLLQEVCCTHVLTVRANISIV
jgi:hypothetical protein